MNEIIDKLIKALAQLMDEANTNYLFGEAKSELEALENAEKVLDEALDYLATNPDAEG